MKRLIGVVFVLALTVVGSFVRASSASAAPTRVDCYHYDMIHDVLLSSDTAHTTKIEVKNADDGQVGTTTLSGGGMVNRA